MNVFLNCVMLFCYKVPLPAITAVRYLYNHYLFACKCIPHAKYKRIPLKYQFPGFFTTLDLLWPKFCPKDQTHFTFFG